MGTEERRPRIVQVPSRSRPGDHHDIDLETGQCDCEGYAMRKRCRHWGEARVIAEKEGYRDPDPPDPLRI